MAYAKLAESPSIKSAFSTVGGEKEKPEGDLILNILPISAQSAGLLPKQNGIFMSYLHYFLWMFLNHYF